MQRFDSLMKVRQTHIFIDRLPDKKLEILRIACGRHLHHTRHLFRGQKTQHICLQNQPNLIMLVFLGTFVSFVSFTVISNTASFYCSFYSLLIQLANHYNNQKCALNAKIENSIIQRCPHPTAWGNIFQHHDI